MADELGMRLRRERERRKIPLESIAATTKVSLALLRDLERDDLSRWPGGIFRRAFIRSYAIAIGVDADAVVHEFLERFPDPTELVAEVAAAPKAAPASLRLTLADAGSAFKGGRVLLAHRRRLAAVLLDAAIAVATGGAFALTIGAFWMPVAVFTSAYYWGGILLLGNTPGVCLLAPSEPGTPPDAPASTRKPRWLAALIARRRPFTDGGENVMPARPPTLAPR